MMKNKSICLFLGPFRNLSTLVGSYLSLHPNCQVLNHGWGELPKENNFLVNYNDGNIEYFIDFVMRNSNTTDKIGSMTTSHAYKSNNNFIKEYKKQFNESLIKENIMSYVWKEGGRISRELRKNGLIEKIISDNKDIKFIRPVRNPLRCAISNIERKHGKHFVLKEEEVSIADFITELMDEYEWIYKLQKKYPENFFFLHENDIHNGLEKVQGFLNIGYSNEWLESCKKIGVDKKPINNEIVKNIYTNIINEKFKDDNREYEILKKYL